MATIEQQRELQECALTYEADVIFPAEEDIDATVWQTIKGNSVVALLQRIAERIDSGEYGGSEPNFLEIRIKLV